ncbi:MAG: hypothetical protein ACI4L7_00285 [Christensenellales bacterium]
MENENRLEQPEIVLTSDGDVEIDKKGDSETSGSNLGKFRDSRALYEAYNNLHSDYTKKCQLLSALQKKLKDNEDKNSPCSEEGATCDNSCGTSSEEEVVKSSQKEDGKIAEQTKKEALKEYVMMDKDLRDFVVAKFFDENTLPISPKLIGSDKGSSPAFAPASKPKTLEEAEVLAKELLQKSNKN